MAIRMTPAQYAEKQARNLKNSTEDIRAGVNAVTESPTVKAAAKADKMLAGIQEAVSSGKWQRGLQKVTVDQWREATITKGLPRIAAGIDAAYDKQVTFAEELFAYENRLLTEIDRMPDLTLEDSISRSSAWIRGMAKFTRS